MANSQSLLKLNRVTEVTACSKSHLYAMIRRGEFPAPIRLSARAVAWREGEVMDWLNSRPSARAGG